MARFSSSVIFFMAFELGAAAGLGQLDAAGPWLKEASLRSPEEPSVRLQTGRSAKNQLMSFTGIQDSRELNKTCCLNGGTCMLGSFCACPPYFFGRNCEHDVRRENCGSVPHDTWLPKKCSMCKCWHGWLRCLPQTFLPGCDGHVMGEQSAASRTTESMPPARTPLVLAGACLSVLLSPLTFAVF
ncbi:teratocarcinoma-derived growth factor 1 [Echinops telfairi]|uniref:Teratocarcinoma-derived growth factor 1 n=1 Tax=Echinops telfairi TaxID=9371 RepID=A0AC55DPI7_ECHTE|nr:teratocarcinoma-derived growth factor 1 [Echinops telfairi]